MNTSQKDTVSTPAPAMTPLEKPLLPRIGKWLAVLILAALVVAGGRVAFRFVKLRMALVHAQRQFSERQFMRAEFWAGTALGVDPANVEALRLMAEIDEAQDKPAALGWRIRVVQHEPGNAADIMAYAKSALRFGQEAWALRALRSLPPAFRERSAEYHEMMGGCALADHETRVAEAHFAKAAELDHANPVHRMNLDAFRLANSPSPEVRAAAARDLEEVLPDPGVSLFATRALLRDAILRRDRAGTKRFAEKLGSLLGHSFGDELNCLQALVSEPAAFQPALKEMEHRAEANAAWTTEAGEWLTSQGMAAETLRWFGQLPEPLKADIRVQMTMAEAYLALREWKDADAFLAKCHWAQCECLRRAMRIRCQRELSHPWENDWKQLAAESEASPPDALLLAQLVIGWNWRDETLALLWGASATPGTDSKALAFLWQLYSQTNETRELLRVAKAQIDIDPTNPLKKNNFAFLSLLVDGASERSERLAREASNRDPSVPEWAATYAYALHLAGEEPEAKRVMGNLSSEALARPGIALYHAIILAANGDYPKARESLAKLNPNGMLPEEQKLAADLAQQLKAASR